MYMLFTGSTNIAIE